MRIVIGALVLALATTAHAQVPVADAGSNQTVGVGATAQLNGSGSTDPNSLPLTYSWTLTTKPGGSAAVLSNPTAVNPTFSADVVGTYVARLIVNNGTANSAPDTVTIIAQLPTADAGPDQTVSVGSLVQLNGSASSDASGLPLTYAWTLTTRPGGSAAVLSNPTAVNPTFSADVVGTYVARLIVNNGTANSAPDTVTITAQLPTADAGPDQTVSVGSLVQLNGSASSDASGLPLTYAWTLTTRPGGSAAVLSNPTAVNPTFSADVVGTYVARLIVNNGTANSAPDTVTITAQLPIANAGPDQTVSVGSLVQLNGSASSDASGLPLTFTWTLTIKPGGSAAALSNPTAVNPTFTADVAGTYVAQLIVNNGAANSLPDAVTITAQLPKANAGPDQTVGIGATVQLNGSASSDASGLPLTYAWTLVSTPGGSTATLSNPIAVNPTFVADLAGSYVVQLTVNNGSATSLPDTVTITAVPPVAGAPAASPLGLLTMVLVLIGCGLPLAIRRGSHGSV